MNTGVYIEIPKYREVLDTLDLVKSKIVTAKKIMKELHSIRSQEHKHLQMFVERLAAMQRVIEQAESEVPE